MFCVDIPDIQLKPTSSSFVLEPISCSGFSFFLSSKPIHARVRSDESNMVTVDTRSMSATIPAPNNLIDDGECMVGQDASTRFVREMFACQLGLFTRRLLGLLYLNEGLPGISTRSPSISQFTIHTLLCSLLLLLLYTLLPHSRSLRRWYVW